MVDVLLVLTPDPPRSKQEGWNGECYTLVLTSDAADFGYKKRDCTFIMEFVEERLKLVEPFISFDLDISSAGDFCAAKTNRGLINWCLIHLLSQ